jgi:hypothetical protein
MNGWDGMDFIKSLASNDFGTFSGIITFVAFVVSMAVIIVSNSIGKRALYAKTVSENRVEWLYKIRRMVHNFIKLSREKGTEDHTLMSIKNQIQLYYNIDEQESLITLLDKIIIDRENENLKEELIKHCQVAFKSEWEKVKKEAGEPIIKRILAWMVVKKNSKWYKKPWVWLISIGGTLIIIFFSWYFKETLIQLINLKINLKSSNLKLPSQTVINNNFNAFKDILLPIALSIISAIIFWISFTFLPERRRYKKVRPKVEYDLYNIYTILFHYIDLALTHNISSPSMFQNEIRGGIIQKENIVLGLQNKSLINYPIVNGNSFSYIIIGDLLKNLAGRIDAEIDRLFNFNTYLETNEIMLLEKIRTKLFTYDYEANTRMIPVDTSLSYMAENIYEIYRSFLQLQVIVFSNKYYSEFERDIYLYLVQYYYYSNNYKQCKKTIKTKLEKYPDCVELLKGYDLLCDYKLNRKDNLYKKVEDLFNSHIDLVANRTFLTAIFKEDKIQELLKSYYNELEINELINIINQEELQKTNFLKQAQKIKEHFEKMTRQKSGK